MSNPHNPDSEYTLDFDQVQADEMAWIRKRRQAAEIDNDSDETIGLAFSGGGIRSATFNLGITQALEKLGLLKQIDYLSTVSGGGYIGSCLSWLQTRLGISGKSSLFAAPTESPGTTVLDWLRSHGQYLINGKGVSGWTLAASILASTLLNLIVLLPPILLLIDVGSDNLGRISFPPWLKLPGATEISGHTGFALMLWSGLVFACLYVISILMFGLFSGIKFVRSRSIIVLFRKTMGYLLFATIICLTIGLVPVVTGVNETVMHYLQSQSSSTLAAHLSYIVPMITGVFALFTANASGNKTGQSREGLASFGLAILLYGLLSGAYYLIADIEIVSYGWFKVWIVLSLVLAITCDVNWVSMHSYYRGRLAAAYMPPVPREHGSGSNRDAIPQHFFVSDIKPESGGPLQIINTNMNTSNSQQQKLAARGGDNFFVTPLYTGATSTGYRTSKTYMHGQLYLSTAFTISGAAVDPNTYATRSRSISFVMALLNIRLGYWTYNPAFHQHRRPLLWWYIYLAKELFGFGMSEKKSHIHLSDGGHFENLGFYELLRRRCRYIIVSDAGADPETTLSSLGQACERARVDFGAVVDLEGARLYEESQKEMSSHPFLVGNIRYADGSTGEVLYIKPMMQSNLTVDVYSYWRENPSFPHQSTADQFFDEPQFEAYRELGCQTLTQLAGGRQSISSVAELFDLARTVVQADSDESDQV